MKPATGDSEGERTVAIRAVGLMSSLLGAAENRDLGRLVAEEIRRASGARAVVLVARREESPGCEILGHDGDQAAFEFPANSAQCLCSDRIPEAAPCRVTDLPEAHPARRMLTGLGVTSLLRVRLRTDGELVGLVLLLDLPADGLSEEVTELLDLLAPALAPAVQQGVARQRLQSGRFEAEQHAEELERRVAERTAALAAANAELEQARLAALNIMEDALAGRQRAEEITAALQASEEQYRRLVELAQEGIWVIDAQARTVFANPSLARMLGYSQGEMKGRHLFDFMDEAGVEKAKEYLARRAAGVAETHDFEFLKKDGQRVFAAVATAPLQDKDGAYAGAIAGVIDVTERRKAEQRAAGSARRWQTTFNAVRDVVWLLDRDHRVVQANLATARLLGCPPEAVIGRRCWEVVHGTEEPIPECPMRRMEHTRRRETMEIRLEDRWVEVTVDPVLDGQEGYTGAVHIITDITERKRAEERLRCLNQLREKLLHLASSEEKLRFITDAVVEAVDADFARIWILRPGDRCEAGCPHVGSQAAPGPCRNHERCLHLVASSGRYTHLDGKVHSRVPFGFCMVGKIAAGNPARLITNEVSEHPSIMDHKWARELGLVAGAGFRLVDAEGEVLGVMALFSRQVISPEEEAFIEGIAHTTSLVIQGAMAEDARRASEVRFRTVTAHSPVGMFMTNPAGAFLYVNERCAQMVGLPAQGILGDGWTARLHPEDIERVQAAWAGAVREGRSFDEEYRWQHADGTELWTRGSAVPVRDLDGNVTAFIGILIDITGLKRAESERELARAQLQQAQKLESVGRLAGGIAHDFNNLLTSILHYVELGRDGLAANHPVRAYLEEIAADAKRSAGLVRQLLAFARKQVIRPEVLDLNQMISQMLKLLGRLIGEQIDLQWHPGKEVWPVKMDPGQLDQLLANLCVNARDAIGGPGRLVIRTQNVTLTSEAERVQTGHLAGDYVQLSVQDDGCGMDADTLRHIFEPFFTTKGVGRGTGLGLATVFGIIKQNRGFVEVSSRPGEGTTFLLHLPRTHERRVAPSGDTASKTPLRGNETVLVVEDEKSLRITSRLFLTKFGYTVLAASTPAEALDLAHGHQGVIDLLLTDVVMPGMTGRDLAKELQSRRPGLRCLFMSGYTADVIGDMGVLGHGTHFLQKPFNRDELGRKVREALDSTAA